MLVGSKKSPEAKNYHPTHPLILSAAPHETTLMSKYGAFPQFFPAAPPSRPLLSTYILRIHFLHVCGPLTCWAEKSYGSSNCGGHNLYIERNSAQLLTPFRPAAVYKKDS